MKVSSLVYLIQDSKWLFLYRNRKKNDLNHNKWIGVGGKLEQNESIEECAVRETHEETGYQIESLQLRGILYFDYQNKETEKIYLYTSSKFNGEMHACSEGTLEWIPEEQILNLNLWEGDKIFLKRLLNGDKDVFCYHLVYDIEDKLIHYEDGDLKNE